MVIAKVCLFLKSFNNIIVLLQPLKTVDRERINLSRVRRKYDFVEKSIHLTSIDSGKIFKVNKYMLNIMVHIILLI